MSLRLPLPHLHLTRWIRLFEILLFLALFALLAHWVTVLFAGKPLPVAPLVSNAPAPRSNLATEMLGTARLFGSHPVGTLSENVQIIGLIADANTNANGGSVLISVDGRPSKAYKIGSDVEGRRLVAIRAGEIEMEANGLRQVFRLPLSPVQAAPGIVLTNPARP